MRPHKVSYKVRINSSNRPPFWLSIWLTDRLTLVRVYLNSTDGLVAQKRFLTNQVVKQVVNHMVIPLQRALRGIQYVTANWHRGPLKIAISLGTWIPSNTWFLGHTQVSVPDNISIGSSVVARLTVVPKQYGYIDHATLRRTSAATGRINTLHTGNAAW